MGVYVFECLHGPYVKVGHHLVTYKRPNAYYRVAGRGFESVIHPESLNGLLYTKDLRLVGWYPNLTRQDETTIHRTFRQGSVGEFHRAEDRSEIIAMLDALGQHCEVSERDRQKAIRWGYRQIKKRRRKQTIA